MRNLTTVTFKITDHALDEMHSAGMPDRILQRLATIKDREVKGQRDFISILQQTIGYMETTTHREVILKHARTRHKKAKRGLKKPSAIHYIVKVIQSLLLGITILLASYILELLYGKIHSGEPNPFIVFIKWVDSLASAGLFVIFLTVKVLDNLGIIGK